MSIRGCSNPCPGRHLSSIIFDGLVLQGVFYSIRSFCNEAEYCSEIDMVPGIQGKTFIVQVYIYIYMHVDVMFHMISLCMLLAGLW